MNELEALAERCVARANDMAMEAELLDLQFSAMQAQRDTRWQAFEDNKSEATRNNWIAFQSMFDSTRRNIKQTREDEAHYRECAAALRARALAPAMPV